MSKPQSMTATITTDRAGVIGKAALSAKLAAKKKGDKPKEGAQK